MRIFIIIIRLVIAGQLPNLVLKREREREKMTERSISKQEIMYQVLPNRERTNGCKIYNVFVVRHVFNAVVVNVFTCQVEQFGATLFLHVFIFELN